MATTVVGLFDDKDDFNKATTDLADSGFSIHNTRTVTGGANHAKQVREMLEGHGVPDSDIRLYEHGVGMNDHLIVLHEGDDGRAEKARDILNRHHALDIHHAGQVRGFASTTTATTATAPAVTASGVAHSTHMTAPAATTTSGTLQHNGVNTAHTATAANTTRDVATGESVTVPVVEEQIAVGKRAIQRGGARIHTHVVETPVTETVTLREEEVHVDRHAVNRPVSGTDLQNAFQETTIAVTERDEVPVVAKEARVVEEVTIGKQATERTETITDTVRRTDVDVEELNEGDRTVMGNGANTTAAGTTRR